VVTVAEMPTCIAVDAAETQVTSPPAAVTVATVVSADVQLTELVTSFVEGSE
jgi:hypothetical protein